uniref:Uncharacterized protein n=1 Tax=Arundo donax TaxID=35708 RepID=A0A0A9ECI7_ARUDO
MGKKRKESILNISFFVRKLEQQLLFFKICNVTYQEVAFPTKSHTRSRKNSEKMLPIFSPKGPAGSTRNARERIERTRGAILGRIREQEEHERHLLGRSTVAQPESAAKTMATTPEARAAFTFEDSGPTHNPPRSQDAALHCP